LSRWMKILGSKLRIQSKSSSPVTITASFCGDTVKSANLSDRHAPIIAVSATHVLCGWITIVPGWEIV